MDKRISDLKADFTRVVDLKDENIKNFKTLDDKIRLLKTIYSEFLTNNKQKAFIFGLDSFHFQGKLIDIEYDDMKRIYYAITNRMYCEYFKLYKIISDYILENIKDDKKIVDIIQINSNSYPVYKDLEPFKQYDFEITQTIHETIMTLLGGLSSYILHKEHDLELYKVKNSTGLNIDNFIHTFNYSIVMIKEKLLLFISYVEIFHKLHTKFFSRFTGKMHLFISQINSDIRFDDITNINKDLVKDVPTKDVTANDAPKSRRPSTEPVLLEAFPVNNNQEKGETDIIPEESNVVVATPDSLLETNNNTA
uniref:Uncharacterized protein n=1 Tax=viral metagenome TaxID=1070528 RepID=A0A6C0B045_9ZZZZ